MAGYEWVVVLVLFALLALGVLFPRRGVGHRRNRHTKNRGKQP